MSTFDDQTIEASGVTKLEATRRGTITQQLDLWSSRCVLRPLLAENFDFDLARLRELFSLLFPNACVRIQKCFRSFEVRFETPAVRTPSAFPPLPPSCGATARGKPSARTLGTGDFFSTPGQNPAKVDETNE